MTSPNISIRHGKYFDLLGPPQRWQEATIAAAQIELTGSMFELSHRLADYVAVADLSTDTRMLVERPEDAVWVRGRAQQLFQIANTTAEDRGEKTFFSASFLAIITDSSGTFVGIPFKCSDHYGKSGLFFSDDDPPAPAIRRLIANCYWGLLLSDPGHTQDYNDSLPHPGTGGQIRFGVENGEPFVDETE